MNITQRTLDLSPRTLLRLSEVERLIRKHRIIVPPPSRRTLIAWCEDGRLLTAPRSSARSPYLVYEDSFLEWLAELAADP
ncbi:MAG: hypothetical protein IPM59_05885 [Chloracidobacterium sp.]|nr:hypothetical protein [Chloracidobacterium sp.]